MPDLEAELTDCPLQLARQEPGLEIAVVGDPTLPMSSNSFDVGFRDILLAKLRHHCVAQGVEDQPTPLLNA